MKIELFGESEGKVLSVEGILTLDNCHALLDEGKHLASEGYVDVIIDFKKVDFIDSAGMGALISLSKLMKANGGTLWLRNLNQNIDRVIKLARLDTFFNIHRGGFS